MTENWRNDYDEWKQREDQPDVYCNYCNDYGCHYCAGGDRAEDEEETGEYPEDAS